MAQIASVDASFWVHAGMVRGHEDLLSSFDVTVTTAVVDELGALAAAPTSISGQAMKVALNQGKARIVDPSGPLIPEFHKGEKAILTLAIEQPDLVPLIDEVRAYQWAVKKGLAVMSVPLWLATEAISRAGDIPVCISKIKALVDQRHISMLLSYEALSLLAAVKISKGEK